MYETIRIQLNSIYRWMNLPHGLEQDLQVSYHQHRLVSDFPHIGPFCPLYLEVERIGGLPEIIARKNLEALLMAYGMKEENDFRGRYYS